MNQGQRRSAWAALVLVALTGVAAHSAAERTADVASSAAALLGAGAAPLPGLYDASLCVSVAAGPRNCGPVVVDMGKGGQVLVQVNDVSYRLQPVGDQMGVSLFQGTMQLDGFFVRHKWSASTLTFGDPERGARYELQIGTRRFVPQPPAPQ
jgi:hypothetical protein